MAGTPARYRLRGDTVEFDGDVLRRRPRGRRATVEFPQRAIEHNIRDVALRTQTAIADATLTYLVNPPLTGNGQDVAFTLTGLQDAIPGSFQVELAGASQDPRAFTVNTAQTQITFVEAPPFGVPIVIRAVASDLTAKFNALLAALRQSGLLVTP